MIKTIKLKKFFSIDGKGRSYKPERDTFGIANISYGCPWKAYWSQIDYKTQPPSRPMLMGTLVHKLYPKILDEIIPGINIEAEAYRKREYKNLTINGYIDALSDDTVFEFKTTSSLPTTKNFKDMLDGYRVQANMYCWLSNRSQYCFHFFYKGRSRGVDEKAGLIYEIREEFDDKYIAEYFSKLNVIVELMRSGEKPNSEENWRCKGCVYKSVCISKQ